MSTTATKSRPIIFTGDNVLKILRGEKTQSRRTIKPQPSRTVNDWTHSAEVGEVVMYNGWPHRLNESSGKNKRDAGELTPRRIHCPYGKPGDTLYVKEGFAIDMLTDRVVYRADEPNYKPESYSPWKSPLFMPHHFSRLTLEITDVRVERVNEISVSDVRAEGIKWNEGPFRAGHTNHLSAFKPSWDAINGAGSWASNPWVWAITFRKIEP